MLHPPAQQALGWLTGAWPAEPPAATHSSLIFFSLGEADDGRWFLGSALGGWRQLPPLLARLAGAAVAVVAAAAATLGWMAAGAASVYWLLADQGGLGWCLEAAWQAVADSGTRMPPGALGRAEESRRPVLAACVRVQPAPMGFMLRQGHARASSTPQNPGHVRPQAPPCSVQP